MSKSSKIQQVFLNSYSEFLASDFHISGIQEKAARAILNCKSGSLGCNISQCTDCGHMEFHNNSCRNRNCPNCQAVLKEVWVDKRRSEVIDTPYFHVVFTLPHQLNPLIYCNQKLLYGPKHFSNYLPTRSGSGQRPVSSRYSTHGIRSWITMCTCTASFPVADLRKTGRYENLPKAFLSAQKS